MVRMHVSFWIENTDSLTAEEIEVRQTATRGRVRIIQIGVKGEHVMLRDVDENQLDRLARDLAALAGLNVIN